MFLRRSKSLSPAEALAAMTRGELQLIDVRNGTELAEAQVQGARHIALGELAGRLEELDRDRPVAFLCRSGRRSAMATRTATHGGLDAANVRGGVIAWGKAGLPVRRDAPTDAA